MRYCLIMLAVLLMGCPRPSDNPDPVGPGVNCNGRDTTVLKLDIPTFFPTVSVPNDLTEAKFQLGRHLFYEKKLSRNNTVSCGSCHQQGLAFSDGLPKGVGLYGDTVRRSSMAISNMLWEDKFFWDARVLSLEDQALMPIQDHLEMDLTLDEAIDRLSSDTTSNGNNSNFKLVESNPLDANIKGSIVGLHLTPEL